MIVYLIERCSSIHSDLSIFICICSSYIYRGHSSHGYLIRRVTEANNNCTITQSYKVIAIIVAAFFDEIIVTINYSFAVSNNDFFTVQSFNSVQSLVTTISF